MTNHLNFTAEDWDRIERDYTAWWAGELERPLVVISGSEPGPELPALQGFIPNYPDGCSPEQICEIVGQHMSRRHFYGDAFPTCFLNFGAGVQAAFHGAKVHRRPETVWFEPGVHADLADVHPEYDPDNVWWRRVQELTRTACEYWNGDLAVSHTDLGGTLDVLASLRTTEKLLFDLIEQPDEVERLVWELHHLWRRYYDELDAIIRGPCRGTVPWAQTWSPRRGYMLQCDFCYMISPAMFDRFVRPDLAAMCEWLDHGFYHLDGPGALPHLDLLLSIPELRGVQWIPGAGNPAPAEWPDVLRRIRKAGKLAQVHASPQDTLNVCREIGGKGCQFLVGGGFTEETARDFLGEVGEACG
jgi:5-methyltetrahydrofolate--homocysteine methyltransferase